MHKIAPPEHRMTTNLPVDLTTVASAAGLKWVPHLVRAHKLQNKEMLRTTTSI